MTNWTGLPTCSGALCTICMYIWLTLTNIADTDKHCWQASYKANCREDACANLDRHTWLRQMAKCAPATSQTGKQVLLLPCNVSTSDITVVWTFHFKTSSNSETVLQCGHLSGLSPMIAIELVLLNVAGSRQCRSVYRLTQSATLDQDEQEEQHSHHPLCNHLALSVHATRALMLMQTQSLPIISVTDQMIWDGLSNYTCMY